MLRNHGLFVSSVVRTVNGVANQIRCTGNMPRMRLVLCSLAAIAVVVSPATSAEAGLWEKFWAKKHAHHNAKRGYHHHHFHHHKLHGCKDCRHDKDDKHCKSHGHCKDRQPCGKSSGSPCCPCQHYATAPVYQPPIVSAAPVQQYAAIPPYKPIAAPAYQVPLQQTLAPQPVLPQPVVTQPVPAPILQPPVATPQVTMQPVVQNRVIYQPVTHQVTHVVPRYRLVSTRISAPPCYPSANWLGFGCPPPAPMVPSPYVAPPATLTPMIVPTPRAPVTLGREILPLEELAPAPSSGPVPEPRADAGYGAPIPVRAAQLEPEKHRTASASGLFVPAPSAAAIWRARRR